MRKIVTTVFVVICMFLMGSLTAHASDLQVGKTMYEKKRCVMCHALEGKGGKVASDLTGIGSRRDAAWLLRFFKDPKKTSGARMMPVKGTEAELANLAAFLLSHK